MTLARGRSIKPHQPTVLMHVECLRGTGELTLAARVAEALADRGVHVVVASGNTRGFFKESDNIEIKELPTIRYQDGELNAYMTDGKTPRKLSEAPEWAQGRSDRLLKIATDTKPDAVLICYWPFGNGRDPQGNPILDNEMTALLDPLKPGTPVFGSIREVLHVDSLPYGGKPKQAADLINRRFTKLFVHGDPDFIPLSDKFNYATHILPEKIDYTGYACTSHPETGEAKDTIIINAGGGDYRPSSAAVLREAILSLDKVDESFLKGKQVRVLVGDSFIPEEYGKLEALVNQTRSKLAAKGATMKLSRTLPRKDYEALLPRCALFIGQAGVGTMMNILSYHYPAVVVPIEEKEAQGGYNFKEQYVSAKIFEQKGLIRLVKQHELASIAGQTLLAAHINALAARALTQEIQVPIRCNGAEYTADAICAAIEANRSQKVTKTGRNLVDMGVQSR